MKESASHQKRGFAAFLAGRQGFDTIHDETSEPKASDVDEMLLKT